MSKRNLLLPLSCVLLTAGVGCDMYLDLEPDEPEQPSEPAPPDPAPPVPNPSPEPTPSCVPVAFGVEDTLGIITDEALRTYEYEIQPLLSATCGQALCHDGASELASFVIPDLEAPCGAIRGFNSVVGTASIYPSESPVYPSFAMTNDMHLRLLAGVPEKLEQSRGSEALNETLFAFLRSAAASMMYYNPSTCPGAPPPLAEAFVRPESSESIPALEQIDFTGIEPLPSIEYWALYERVGDDIRVVAEVGQRCPEEVSEEECDEVFLGSDPAFGPGFPLGTDRYVVLIRSPDGAELLYGPGEVAWSLGGVESLPEALLIATAAGFFWDGDDNWFEAEPRIFADPFELSVFQAFPDLQRRTVERVRISVAVDGVISVKARQSYSIDCGEQ
ncbi:hypothetical protein [Haliangium sp.]|uniref:hypothetical protein n=1 Tax=Haliangium sp. TaxID=2663208 RepID=UPI003D0A0F9E